MVNFLFTKTPLIFFIQPFWRDEAFSYLLAKKNIAEIFYLTAKDFNPPLYYLFLHFWIKIFGSSEIAIRLMSLIFYWLTLYVVSLFLENILKMKIKKTIFYTLFFAFNPLLLYYAFEARNYTLFAFFASLSFYFLYKKKWRPYLISSVLGLYTHYFMIFVLVFQYFLKKSKKQLQAFLYFIPWLIFVIFNKGLIIEDFWIKKLSFDKVFNFISQIYTGYEYDFKFYDHSIFYLSLVFWIIIFYGYLKTKNNQKDYQLYKYFFVWGVIIPFFVFLISLIKPIFLPRYLIFANIGLILLLIYSLEKLPKFFRVFIIALIILVTFNYNHLQIKNRNKSKIKNIINEISYLRKKDDLVYVVNELDFFTVQYYLKENFDKVFIFGKTYEEIPNYVGKILIDRNKITNKLPIYPNKAFIIQNNQYEIKSIF